MLNIKIISAGAGSGKTYRLTEEMVKLLCGEGEFLVRPSGIMATTFTKKAAAELQERVRVKLLEKGMSREADELANALIGTVHGLGVKLLKRFAFEAGVSPDADIMADEDQQTFFNNSLAAVLTPEIIEKVELLSERLGLGASGYGDWRREVKFLTDIARANAFDIETLEQSKAKSIASLLAFLPKANDHTFDWYNSQLEAKIEDCIDKLRQSEDTTKTTQTAKNNLQNFHNKLKAKGELAWYEWVKIAKQKIAKKSQDLIEELQDFAWTHENCPQFHEDISAFIAIIFDISIEALREYEEYKKQRGLIDYIDMEIHVNRLLENPMVQEVLEDELDLLMVDEFQDTNPIQLEIFLKLTKYAKLSIWVGDPKQSIYGFRGADPKLMQAIIEKTGGVKPEDIQKYSWRSRPDVVNAVNAVFVKAFPDLPPERVALIPKREDHIEQGQAIIHWHYEFEGSGRKPGKPWMENCIARSIKEWLDGEKAVVVPKGSKTPRKLLPSDVAILCRSNKDCQLVAEALSREGLKAAISRTGLLSTAEAKLILACLKFIYNQNDSLSISEILYLASQKSVEDIILHRIDFLEKQEAGNIKKDALWAEENEYVDELEELIQDSQELSSAEILDLVLETLDLRRIIAQWGNVAQRFANVDALRQYALQYEAACNRLHTAASLGGFLLWLNELEFAGIDAQGSGESEDTVQVLTYHKSKGLEWPLVICHSLETNLRDDVFGIKIETASDDVDLNNVLGNRWLRYWIKPYFNQMTNTPLQERLDRSDAKKVATADALAEEARLLYVGMTRARDYLVIPTRSEPTKWLNRCWNEGMEDIPTLVHHDFETPWVWNGQDLMKETQVWHHPRNFAHTESGTEQVNYFIKNTIKPAHVPHEIDIEEDVFPDLDTKTYQPFQYAAVPTFDEEEVDEYTLSKVIKAFLAADDITFAAQERELMAGEIVHRFGIEDGAVDYKGMVHYSEGFYRYLQNRYQPTTTYRKYLVRTYQDRRLFEKFVDFIGISDNHIVIVQHSGLIGDGKKRKKKAKELGSWLYFAGQAVKQSLGKKDIKITSYVNFVMAGSLIKVVVKDTSNQLVLGI